MAKDRFYKTFPNLDKTDHSFDSPEDTRYNCIAWAAGDNKRFWWPDPMFQNYWPHSQRNAQRSTFEKAFSGLGYEVCDSSEHEADFEKVAIYEGPDGKVKHMARQLDNGKWTSKCGSWEDITHTLAGLDSDTYGKAVSFMRRPKEKTT